MNVMGKFNPQMPLPNPAPVACWYAAYTAPCREKRVLEHLAVRGIESFLPLYRSLRKWKNGCRVELERPLFPGYVFVRMAAAERIRVLEVPSVISIVSRGRVPEPLQDEDIAVYAPPSASAKLNLTPTWRLASKFSSAEGRLRDCPALCCVGRAPCGW